MTSSPEVKSVEELVGIAAHAWGGVEADSQLKGDGPPSTRAVVIAILTAIAEALGTNPEGLVELPKELADFQSSFDLRWNADMRAIKQWQEVTGRNDTWPDHADLCMHLMMTIDTGEKTNAALQADIAAKDQRIAELTKNLGGYTKNRRHLLPSVDPHFRGVLERLLDQSDALLQDQGET